MSLRPPGENPQITLRLPPAAVAGVLTAAAVAMCVVHWLGKLAMSRMYVPGIINRTLDRFDVDAEATIPTWFSSLLLLGSSLLLLLIAIAQRRRNADAGDGEHKARARVRQWFLLSGLLLYLAIDEAAEVHEYVINHIPVVVIRLFGGGQAAFDAYEGVFPWYWVLPGAVLVLVVGLWFLPFVLSLPRATRNLFILSAAVFVTGALGFEFISSHYVAAHGRENMTYVTLSTIEELLEMLGVIILIYALLRHLRGMNTDLALSFR